MVFEFLNSFVLLDCPVIPMTLILAVNFSQQNLSDKDEDIINFVRRFSKFYWRLFDIVSKYNV